MIDSCPTPTKKAYPDRPTTKNITVMAGRRIHSYRCVCGSWHVSKRRNKTKRFK